jgi:transcriptional regulator with XRE-family HTH domain
MVRRPLAPWLGSAIRQRRQAAGLSQEALAEEAGLHRTYISMIERAERNISVDALDGIAEALALRASVLIRQAERLRGARARP